MRRLLRYTRLQRLAALFVLLRVVAETIYESLGEFVLNYTYDVSRLLLPLDDPDNFKLAHDLLSSRIVLLWVYLTKMRGVGSIRKPRKTRVPQPRPKSDLKPEM